MGERQEESLGGSGLGHHQACREGRTAYWSFILTSNYIKRVLQACCEHEYDWSGEVHLDCSQSIQYTHGRFAADTGEIHTCAYNSQALKYSNQLGRSKTGSVLMTHCQISAYVSYLNDFCLQKHTALTFLPA